MTDPRGDFVSRIDLASTRVRSFRGFLFLCGGPQSAEAHPLRSARHLIYNTVTSGRHADLADRLRLAEDIQDWFRDGRYSDLVTFEEHLASLSSVILLVVESPGSIAELGAFSVTRAISDRLVTLIAEQHFEEESFIRLGPISRLEATTGRRVLVHEWHDKDYTGRLTPNFALLEPDVPDVLDEVRKLLASNTKERVFRLDEPAHNMLMICELCDLFGALSESEIKEYLSLLTPDSGNETIDQYLFLLEKCEILKIKAKGHGRYFYAPSWTSHVVFGFREGKRIDRDRVRLDVLDYYKSSKKSRAEVVRLISGAQP